MKLRLNYRQSVLVEGSLSVRREAGEPSSEDTTHPCAHQCVISKLFVTDTCRVLFIWLIGSSSAQRHFPHWTNSFFVLSFISTNSLPIAKVIIIIERNIYSRTLTSGRGLWNRYLCSIALWLWSHYRSPDLAVFYVLGQDQLISQQCTPVHSNRHICPLPSADFLWVPAGL